MITLIITLGYLSVAALSIVTIASIIVERMNRSSTAPDDSVEYLMKYSRIVQERNAVKRLLQIRKE